VNARFITLLNPYISVIAVVLCFLPFLLLWWKKLNHRKAYLFIAIYWLINGLVNLPDFMGLPDNTSLANEISLVYNLFDTLLVLLVFYFSANGNKKRVLFYLLILFAFFELVIVAWKGHNWDSSTIIVGTGGLLILIYSIIGVAEYFQKIEHSSFETTMGLVYAAFIFDYGLSIITFFSNYLNYKKETVAENLFVYYMSVIAATMLTSFGLWRYASTKLAEDNYGN